MQLDKKLIGHKFNAFTLDDAQDVGRCGSQPDRKMVPTETATLKHGVYTHRFTP